MNSVKLYVSHEQDTIRRYISRGRRSSFPSTIYWQFDDDYYPAQGWIDSADVLLSVWGQSILDLDKKTFSVVWSFLEGPHQLRVTNHYEQGIVQLQPHNKPVLWTVPFISLAYEVARNLEETYGLLTSMNYMPDAQHLAAENLILELKVAIETLKNEALSNDSSTTS